MEVVRDEEHRRREAAATPKLIESWCAVLVSVLVMLVWSMGTSA
jgi:hypothetical protein